MFSMIWFLEGCDISSKIESLMCFSILIFATEKGSSSEPYTLNPLATSLLMKTGSIRIKGEMRKITIPLY